MSKTVKFSGAACALAALLLTSTSAFGQETRSARISIFASGSILKGERPFSVGGDNFLSNFAKGGKLGARGTVNLSNHWALEGAYGFGRNNLRMFELTSPVKERAFGVRSHQFSGNVLYFVGRPSKLRPFLTSGLGLTRYSPTAAAKAAAAAPNGKFVDDPAAIGSVNKMDFNFGGGVETKFNSHLGGRVDVRDHVTAIPRFGVPQVKTSGFADYYPVDGRVHGIEISVGLVFYPSR